MSQLIKAIKAHDTGNRVILKDQFRPLFLDMVDIKSETYTIPYEATVVYKIGVTFGAQAMVSQTGETLHQAIIRTKQQVIQAVFGEFREDIIMIERALYDRDFDAARENLWKLNEKMFGDK